MLHWSCYSLTLQVHLHIIVAGVLSFNPWPNATATYFLRKTHRCNSHMNQSKTMSTSLLHVTCEELLINCNKTCYSHSVNTVILVFTLDCIFLQTNMVLGAPRLTPCAQLSGDTKYLYALKCSYTWRHVLVVSIPLGIPSQNEATQMHFIGSVNAHTYLKHSVVALNYTCLAVLKHLRWE